jgi:DNA-binding LacI/PurR family transcriptional regulator
VSADLLDPPMTSLDRLDRDLGRVAAEALLRSLGGEDAPGEIVRLPPALSVRSSCGCGLTVRGD